MLAIMNHDFSMFTAMYQYLGIVKWHKKIWV